MGSPIRSDDVYFANTEQTSLMFFIARAEHNLIKLKLYNNHHKLLIIFRRVVCEIQANKSNCLTFENYPINQR